MAALSLWVLQVHYHENPHSSSLKALFSTIGLRRRDGLVGPIKNSHVKHITVKHETFLSANGKTTSTINYY